MKSNFRKGNKAKLTANAPLSMVGCIGSEGVLQVTNIVRATGDIIAMQIFTGATYVIEPQFLTKLSAAQAFTQTQKYWQLMEDIQCERVAKKASR